MEGLRIAPIGQGAYRNAPRRKPTLTDENLENVWSLDLDEIVESTKENIRKYGPNNIVSGNLSWANKPVNMSIPPPSTPKNQGISTSIKSPPRLVRTKRARNLLNINYPNAKRAKTASQRRMRRRKNKTRRSN